MKLALNFTAKADRSAWPQREREELIFYWLIREKHIILLEDSKLPCGSTFEEEFVGNRPVHRTVDFRMDSASPALYQKIPSFWLQGSERY